MYNNKLYDKFIDNLPQEYSAFTKNLNILFPYIIDTKYLITNLNSCSELIKKNSVLDKSFEYYFNNNQINFILNKDFKEYDLLNNDDKKSHEAGYDSLITGYVFFNILKEIGLLKYVQERDTLYDKLKFFRNKVLLGGLRSCMDFEDSYDYLSDNKNLFYIKVLQLNDLEYLKQKFSSKYGAFNIYNIYSDDLAFFIIFVKNDSYTDFTAKYKELDIGVIINLDECIIQVKTYKGYTDELQNKINKIYY